MIATVRIAPVERWCEAEGSNDIVTTRGNAVSAIVGQPVQIRIESFTKDEVCGGKAWYITQESADRLDDLLGREHFDGENLICEHMLEMD